MDEFSDCEDVHQNCKFKHERTIIHIDLDCFYAQVEMLKNPELAMKPVGIKQQHYIITSNYVAREYGVKKCMLITEALALCPKLIIVNGEDLHDYRIMSNKVSDVIRKFSNKVEKLGLDENFVDVSLLVLEKLKLNNYKTSVKGHIYKNDLESCCFCGCKERLTIGSQIAEEIRIKIKEELGMTCCAGIAYNKLLAKLVGPTHKPNQQTTVFPCAALSLVSSLSCVRAIPGIGRKTSDILEAVGIYSISDAQNVSVKVLEKHLGKTMSLWIKGACFGVDDNEVKESGKQQVIGLEEAAKRISTMQEVENKINSLIERGMVLVREDGRFPTTIRVSVRKYSQQEEYIRQRESKQCSINPSVFRTSTANEQIFEIALSLFKKLVDHTKPFHLTLLGLAFTKFQEETPAKNSLMQLFKKKFEEKNEGSSKTVSAEKNIFHVNSSKQIFTKTNSLVKEHKLQTTSFGDIDEAILKELPNDIREEILETYSKQPNMSCAASSSKQLQSSVACPAGIDPEVFQELPHEIQLELTGGSKNSESSIPKPKSKKQNSIVNYFQNEKKKDF